MNDEKIEVVLVIRDGDKYLLRGDRRVTLTILDYDHAEDILRTVEPEDLLDQPQHDARGEPYYRLVPPVICWACGDWIGDDEPREQHGTGHEAASRCLPCQQANR